MAISKITRQLDNRPLEVLNLDFDLPSDLAAGNHTETLRAYEGAILVDTKVRNFNVQAESSYDSDYQAKLDKATELGIPLPTASQNTYYNQRVVDYKAANDWNIPGAVFDFTGDADINFKLICVKRRVKGIAYGGGTWDNRGWKGNGVNAYIDPLYNTIDANSNWSLNDAGVGWTSFSLPTTGYITGGFVSAAADNYTLVGYLYVSINDYSGMVSSYIQLGYNSVHRVGDSEVKYNGSGSRGVPSKKVYDNKLYIGARVRIDRSSVDGFYDGGIGFITIGGNSNAAYNNLRTMFQ